MLNKKFLTTILIFSFLLFCTSIVKNKTRVIEKNILNHKTNISNMEKELHESFLDFNYLSSPAQLTKQIEFLSNEKYKNKIFIATQEELNNNRRARSAKLRFVIRNNKKFKEPEELKDKFKYLLELEGKNA